MIAQPNSAESEYTLLGIAVNYPKYLDAFHALPADAFYSPLSIRLRELILSLEAPTQTAILSALQAKGELEKWGGPHEISHVLQLETSGLWPDAVKQVLDCLRRRLLLSASEKIRLVAERPSADESELVAGADAACAEATRSLLDTGNHLKTIKEWMPDVVTELERAMISKQEVTGISSGLPKLDRVTCGFQPGEMIVVGARPSCCKTIMGAQFAFHAASHGNPVVIFSREMRASALIKRAIHSHSSVPNNLTDIRERGNVKAIFNSTLELANLPIWIDQTPGLTVESMALKFRRMCRANGIKLAIVDYLQMLSVECGRMDAYERVSYISSVLKQAAGDAGVALIVLAQLNRKGTDEPSIEHLRDSGQIEQDADLVLILNRPKKDETTEVEPFTIDIAKQRNGATGIRDFQFRKTCFRIEEPWK